MSLKQGMNLGDIGFSKDLHETLNSNVQYGAGIETALKQAIQREQIFDAKKW